MQLSSILKIWRSETFTFYRLEQVVEEDITLVKEVDSAIAAYEKSGKIPSSVIEAAIFRKPYFLNKFLPILLKPRYILFQFFIE